MATSLYHPRPQTPTSCGMALFLGRATETIRLDPPTGSTVDLMLLLKLPFFSGIPAFQFSLWSINRRDLAPTALAQKGLPCPEASCCYSMRASRCRADLAGLQSHDDDMAEQSTTKAVVPENRACFQSKTSLFFLIQTSLGRFSPLKS